LVTLRLKLRTHTRRGAAGGLAARRGGEVRRIGERVRERRRRSGLAPPRRRGGVGLLREELTVVFSPRSACAGLPVARGERERRLAGAPPRPRSSRARFLLGEGERVEDELREEERLEPELEPDPELDEEALLEELEEAERPRRFPGDDFSFAFFSSTILV
jgi:hypothetical protein